MKYHCAFLLMSCVFQTAWATSFESLRNPLLQYKDWSIKDCAVAKRQDGLWVLFFSAFYQDRGRIRSHVVGVNSVNLRDFSRPFFHVDGREHSWRGMASPNLSYMDGHWVLTYNSWGDKSGMKNQLFYRVSADLVNWGPELPLARNLTRGMRSIDVAATKVGDWVYLIWKENQTPRLARGKSLTGSFEFVGRGYPEFFSRQGERTNKLENYQFINHGQKMLIVATHMKKKHRPWIYTMISHPRNPQSWLKWSNGIEIRIPNQGFNNYHRANAACLALNSHRNDPYHYLFYAGNQYHTRRQFAGRGWNRLGIARGQQSILNFQPARRR